MAEGTTRVDETGGEPIASHLEWTAAKVERGRPASAASPDSRRTEERQTGPSRAQVERMDQHAREVAAYRAPGGREAVEAHEAAERMQREARKAAANRPPKTKEALRRDIEANRRVVAEIVEELDLRRRELMDVRVQFRRYRLPILGGSFGFAMLVGAGAWLIVRRQQLRRRPIARARRLREAIGRMVDRPETLARPSPNVREKVLAAVASGASGVLATRVAQRIAASL